MQCSWVPGEGLLARLGYGEVTLSAQSDSISTTHREEKFDVKWSENQKIDILTKCK